MTSIRMASLSAGLLLSASMLLIQSSGAGTRLSGTELAPSPAYDSGDQVPGRNDWAFTDGRAATFRNVEAILPTRRVAPPDKAFPLREPTKPFKVTYTFGGGTHTLADFVTRTDTTALLVLKKDQILFEGYYQGADRQDLFMSFSSGKSVTSTLVGLAVSEGRIARSGDAQARLLREGAVVWQGFVAGARVGRAYAGFSDLTGDPVIVGDTLYAGSSAGRVTAIDMATGLARWTAEDGAMSPVVAAGNALFLVNDEDQLLRLDAATGAVTWRIDLPYFQNDKKDVKRKSIFAHYGPVLAGGRLIVASSDGLVRAFDPASGRLTGSAAVRGGAAAAPVVAGGTLYIVTTSGQLAAFR